MATGTTKLTNVIDPEVMADMVTAKLDKAIKFTPLAYVERACLSTFPTRQWSRTQKCAIMKKTNVTDDKKEKTWTL